MTSTYRRQRRSRRRPIVRHRSARAAAPCPERAFVPLRVQMEQHATIALLTLSGEFDIGGVDLVERSFDGAVDALTDAVVFDLRGVSFLDLCGLEVLLRADARARSESFALAVVPPRGPTARIFTLSGAGRELALLDVG